MEERRGGARLLRTEYTPDDLNESVMNHEHGHGGFGPTAATKQGGVEDHSAQQSQRLAREGSPRMSKIDQFRLRSKI